MCGGRLSASTRGRPQSRFCSRKCKDDFRHAENRAQTQLKRAEQRCEHCSGPIPLDAGSRVRTCSKVCGVAWQNVKRAEAKRAAWRAEGLRCQCCEQLIPVPESGRRRTKFCSLECKKRVQDARWRERSPGYMRQYLYGVTPEQWAAALEAQDDACAICGSPDWPGKDQRPHTDHDHATGAFRGILCGNCNNGLGMFADDPARLRLAAEYLERAAAGRQLVS